MKIAFLKAGGLLGILQPAKFVDGSHLEVDEFNELSALVQAAKAESKSTTNQSERTASESRLRDAMVYKIVIEDDGRKVEMEQVDGLMSPCFARLRQWLEKHLSKLP